MNNNTLKSTRLKMVLVLFAISLVFAYTGYFAADKWIDFIKWLFGLYAASEAYRKGVEK